MLPPVISLARKVELFIGGLLLITVVVLAVQVWVVRHRADVVKEEVHAVTADLGAAQVHAVEVQRIYIDKKVKDENVRQAIESNPDWAATELPTDVADQLRHSSGTERAVP